MPSCVGSRKTRPQPLNRWGQVAAQSTRKRIRARLKFEKKCCAAMFARHLVLSPSQAILHPTVSNGWRAQHDRFDSYTKTLVALYDDDTIPILQYDDRRGMAILVARSCGGMLKITNHLSCFNDEDEARSRSECARWMQKWHSG